MIIVPRHSKEVAIFFSSPYLWRLSLKITAPSLVIIDAHFLPVHHDRAINSFTRPTRGLMVNGYTFGIRSQMCIISACVVQYATLLSVVFSRFENISLTMIINPHIGRPKILKAFGNFFCFCLNFYSLPQEKRVSN